MRAVRLLSMFLVFFGGLCGTTHAASIPVFFGPTPYLSVADIPVGFYATGPTALEDFEDGTLDFGLSASNGHLLSTANSISVDSVDADDGSIDGSGLTGKSWIYVNGDEGITFTFPTLVTAAGLVWTDGPGVQTFEAFGPGMVSLGTIGPFALADGVFLGQTQEDRFFGVQNADGISAIRVFNTSGTALGIEVDHVQFGVAPVPEPNALVALASLACLGSCLATRRRRAATRWLKR